MRGLGSKPSSVQFDLGSQTWLEKESETHQIRKALGAKPTNPEHQQLLTWAEPGLRLGQA